GLRFRGGGTAVAVFPIQHGMFLIAVRRVRTTISGTVPPCRPNFMGAAGVTRLSSRCHRVSASRFQGCRDCDAPEVADACHHPDHADGLPGPGRHPLVVAAGPRPPPPDDGPLPGAVAAAATA